MGVRVDPSRQNDLAARINDFRVRGIQILPDCGYFFSINKDVSRVSLACRDDRTRFDDE